MLPIYERFNALAIDRSLLCLEYGEISCVDKKDAGL